MENQTTFNIYVHLKIPFISTLLGWIIVVPLAIVLLLYVLMSPSKDASPEMQTAYYLLIIPDTFKKLSAWAILSLIILVPLYYKAKLRKAAIFTTLDDAVQITGDKIDISIPKNRIRKIHFNDLHNLLRRPTKKIQIVIEEKNRKKTVFFLADYQDADAFIDLMGKLENIEPVFNEDAWESSYED